MSLPPLSRRNLLWSAAAGVAASQLSHPVRAEEPAGPPPVLPRTKGPKNALFVYGGWDGHQPEKCRDIFVPWLKKQGFKVTVSNNLDPYADLKLMSSLDLIVQIWTMGTIKKEQLSGLLNAVRGGVGIAGWHGGLGDAFRQETEYQFMIGGQWVAHPGGVIGYKVNVTEHEDPITRGVPDFDLKSEQYYMHVDPNNKVLATTRFTAEHASWIEDAVMPVAWKKVYGKGRVFYTSMGHNVDVFDRPEALGITQRGILWASDSRREDTQNLISPAYPSR
ncbi:MAG: ThuA domain-containing protein [Deltaproteobacteria bacterium]|nr:ThuA domain-containing protein [Deltaproteobacteria bacterium]